MTADDDSGALWAEPTGPAQLGEFVALVRRTEHLTQGQLAAHAGVPRRFINELEGGHATKQTERLFDVLAALGLRLVVKTDERWIRSAAASERVGDVGSPEPPAVKDLGW